MATSELKLKGINYYEAEGVSSFQSIISKIGDDKRTWNIISKIPEKDSQEIWATIVQYWGGGDAQKTLQKLIDLGT